MNIRRILLTAAIAAIPAAAPAGGGPENVLLVVNRNSPASRTIANHYMALRQIPPGNVLTLAWDPSAGTTDVATLREKILTPIFTVIEKRRLARQIDYVIYSSDFPWEIDLKADARKFLDAAKAKAGQRAAEPTWPKSPIR